MLAQRIDQFGHMQMGTCPHVMVDGNLVTLRCMSALVTLWCSALFIPLWRYLGWWCSVDTLVKFIVQRMDVCSTDCSLSHFYQCSSGHRIWCHITLSWSQCSIGHWRSHHSPYLGISLPVWTSDFPPYPLALPAWTANFPPLSSH